MLCVDGVTIMIVTAMVTNTPSSPSSNSGRGCWGRRKKVQKEKIVLAAHGENLSVGAIKWIGQIMITATPTEQPNLKIFVIWKRR